jgi:hypothetical protein
MFLSALRRAGIPLQQIRPMLDLVRTKLGIEHALASRRLYVAGAQLPWEVSTEDDVDEKVRHTARDLIVLRDGQYVFRQVVGKPYARGCSRRERALRRQVAAGAGSASAYPQVVAAGGPPLDVPSTCR